MSQGSTAPPAVVGALGLPQAIDFEGNQSFTARALREGLAGWPDFLLAAHPAAPLAEYLQAIRVALTRGYRDAGFPETRLDLATDARQQRILVKVAEGPRFNRGEVRVNGSKEVSAIDLAHYLTEPPSKAPDRLAQAVETILEQQRAPKLRATAEAKVKQLNEKLPTAQIGKPPIDTNQAWLPNYQNEHEIIWERGKPVSFNDGFLQHVVQEVRRHLAERGHPLAEVSATLQTNDSTHLANLAIVVSEGPRAVIGSIDVAGLQRNTREDILKLTGLGPGMPATPEALTQAKLALWNSARFYSFDLTPTPRPAPAREVDIAIEVDENENMPPLREPLARYQTALVRFANWMTIQTGQQELAFFTTAFDRSPLHIAFSPGRGLVLRSKGKAGDELGFILGPGGGRAYAAIDSRVGRREFGSTNMSWNVWVHFVTNGVPTGTAKRSNLAFGASFQTISGDSKPGRPGLVDLDLILSPAFACLNLAGGADPRFESGTVVIVSPAGHPILRFQETTGELLEWNLAEFGEKKNPEEGPAISAIIRGGRGDFDQTREAIESAWRALPASQAIGSSFGELLLAQPWVQSLIRLFSSEASGAILPRANLSLLARLAERVIDLPEMRSLFSGDQASGDPAFTISPDPLSTIKPSLLVNLLGAKYYQVAVMLWPADTWPAKLTRELFYILTGNTKYTGAVMEQLYQDPRMGPLGSVLTAQLLRKYNTPLAWRFARRALEHSSPEDFRNDWRMLIDSQSPLGRMSRELLTFTGDLSEQERKMLTATLPDAEAALLLRAVNQLRQQRDRPIEDVLQPLLDEWWVKNMQPDLENRVGSMMAAAPVDAAIDAATVNGIPISRKLLSRRIYSPQDFAWIPQLDHAAGAPADNSPDRVLADLVTLTLVLGDFSARGGIVKDEFLDEQINRIVKLKHGGDQRAFESGLAQEGLTPAEYRETLRLRQIFGFMSNQAINDHPAPSDTEIGRAIAATPPDEEYRNLRALGVRKTFPNTEEARARAEEIRAQAIADGTFDKVWAKPVSDVPNAPQRIKLPKVRRADLKKELADVAFSLEPNGISSVVENGDSFLVLHLDTVSRISPEDLRRQVSAQLALQKPRIAVLTYLKRLRDGAIVRTLADPALTATNIVAAQAGTIRLELEALPVALSRETTLTSQPTMPLDSQRWSEGRQALYGNQADDWIEWELNAPTDGDYRLELFATRAPDFGVVQIAIDGKPLGLPVELFAPRMQPSGAVGLGGLHLHQGSHRFRCTIVGKHPSSVGYRFGLDAIDLIPGYGAETLIAPHN